jgi:hypothetical protein
MSVPPSKGCDEIFERLLAWYRRDPVDRNRALRFLQQAEDFCWSNPLPPISAAPEANYSLYRRDVSGRERNIPFELPDRIALVGRDENDRAIAP